MAYIGCVESGEDSPPNERKESLLVTGEKELSLSVGEEKKDYSASEGRAGREDEGIGGLGVDG